MSDRSGPSQRDLDAQVARLAEEMRTMRRAVGDELGTVEAAAIAAAMVGGYVAVLDEGAMLPARTGLSFVGPSVLASDDTDYERTKVLVTPSAVGAALPTLCGRRAGDLAEVRVGTALAFYAVDGVGGARVSDRFARDDSALPTSMTEEGFIEWVPIGTTTAQIAGGVVRASDGESTITVADLGATGQMEAQGALHSGAGSKRAGVGVRVTPATGAGYWGVLDGTDAKIIEGDPHTGTVRATAAYTATAGLRIKTEASGANLLVSIFRGDTDALLTSWTDTTPLTGSAVGIAVADNSTGDPATVDEFCGHDVGTLAWVAAAVTSGGAIQDDGATLTARKYLNFVGEHVAATDAGSTLDRIDVRPQSFTRSPGLPSTVGRRLGDAHQDSDTGIGYVLDGSEIGEVEDTWTRADATDLGVTEIGGTAWTNSLARIVSGTFQEQTLGTRGRAQLDFGTDPRIVESQFSNPAGSGDFEDARLYLGATTASENGAGGWMAQVQKTIVAIYDKDGNNVGQNNAVGLAAAESATFRLETNTARTIAKLYKNDVLVLTSSTAGAATGNFVGLAVKSGADAVSADEFKASRGEPPVWVAISGAGESAHLADAVDAHDAAAISYAGGTGMSATDVEGAIDELATEKSNTDHGHTGAAGTVATSETMTAATYGDLTTSGPTAQVTVPASGIVLVTVQALLSSDVAAGVAAMSASGTGLTAADAQSIRNVGTDPRRYGATIAVTGLTPGATPTYTAKYRSDGTNTATFVDRTITAVPA